MGLAFWFCKICLCSWTFCFWRRRISRVRANGTTVPRTNNGSGRCLGFCCNLGFTALASSSFFIGGFTTRGRRNGAFGEGDTGEIGGGFGRRDNAGRAGPARTSDTVATAFCCGRALARRFADGGYGAGANGYGCRFGRNFSLRQTRRFLLRFGRSLRRISLLFARFFGGRLHGFGRFLRGFGRGRGSFLRSGFGRGCFRRRLFAFFTNGFGFGLRGGLFFGATLRGGSFFGDGYFGRRGLRGLTTVSFFGDGLHGVFGFGAAFFGCCFGGCFGTGSSVSFGIGRFCCLFLRGRTFTRGWRCSGDGFGASSFTFPT